MNITIIGAGFLGKSLLEEYMKEGHYIKVLDHNPCPQEFEQVTQWINGCYTKRNKVIEAVEGSDVVFHLISTTVPVDVINEQEEIINNVMPSIQLIKTCIEEEVKRIVFVSSSSVYGVKNRLPIIEDGNTEPISAHGMQKLIIEKFYLLYQYLSEIDCKIIRLSNPFGPRQNIYGRQGFIAIVLGNIISRSPVCLRGDGNNVRDFIYISDVIKAFKLIAETDSDETIFNIGSGYGTTLLEVIKLMEEITGNKIEVNLTASLTTEIPSSILDISKANKILNYCPEISMKEGLEKVSKFHNII